MALHNKNAPTVRLRRVRLDEYRAAELCACLVFAMVVKTVYLMGATEYSGVSLSNVVLSCAKLCSRDEFTRRMTLTTLVP